MNDEYQQIAMNAVCHAAEMTRATWAEAAFEYMRPCAIFKPRLSLDGSQWCALYGENLQDGVAGFGDTPHEAMRDFDRNWLQQRAQPKSGGSL